MITPSPQVWFLPGANATPTSFTYLQSQLEKNEMLKDSKFIKLQYDSQDAPQKIVNLLLEKMPRNIPIILIGHSLGGVLAVSTSQNAQRQDLGIDIKAVITLASPVGGSEGADYLQWMFPHYHLFKNIASKGRFVSDVLSSGIVVPTLALVTTSGNSPIFPEANDGVVTVKSQMALLNPNLQEIPFNHFEGLLSEDVAHRMNAFITKIVTPIDAVKL